MIQVVSKPNKKEITTILGKDIHAIIRRHSNPEDYDKYREEWKKSLSLDYVPKYPIQIDFELNYSCNFTCPMCTWSAESNAGKGKATWLNFDIFKQIIDDGVPKGLKAIRLNFINEPLIRRDIIDFIKYAKSKGILDIYLSTNGSLLSNKMSEKIVNSGLTRLQVSLDAFTEETYNKIRTGGDYNKVVSNIMNFVEVRNRLKSELPTLRVNFVKTEVNINELDDFVNFWQDKADCIGIQDLVNIMNPETELKNNNSKQFNCSQPFNHMTVRYDGSILPCCTFFGAKLPLGKIKTNLSETLSKVKTLENNENKTLETMTIEEAWKGKEIEKIREIHKNGKFFDNEICKQCVLSTSHADD